MEDPSIEALTQDDAPFIYGVIRAYVDELDFLRGDFKFPIVQKALSYEIERGREVLRRMVGSR